MVRVSAGNVTALRFDAVDAKHYVIILLFSTVSASLVSINKAF